MTIFRKIQIVLSAALCISFGACKVPAITQGPATRLLPNTYGTSADTVNTASIQWKKFYNDPFLTALIDTALQLNPEMAMTLQEISIARNSVQFKEGALLPSVNAGIGLGIEKVGLYTSQGAGDASADIVPGKKVPEHLPDLFVGFRASWEADIWGKLHTAKKSAYLKYLSSVEGRNFVQTNLIAEIARSYYELLSLDNQLSIIRDNIQLQQEVLDIVKIQKEAAVVTELAVKQFEAQLLSSKSMEYEVLQEIVVNENKINFLLGRYPQKIERSSVTFLTQHPAAISAGIPAQLLELRPDVRQAALDIEAAKLELQVAQKEFYPSLGLSGLLGFSAFKPSLWFTVPESFAYALIGDAVAPIINRKALFANFNNATAEQRKALINYQRTLLNGYQEVSTQVSSIHNLEKSYQLKSEEASALNHAVEVSDDLYKAARANYLEVLTTQREALSTKLELVEMKQRQFMAMVALYQALGGGW